jgi:hypothetical protein
MTLHGFDDLRDDGALVGAQRARQRALEQRDAVVGRQTLQCNGRRCALASITSDANTQPDSGLYH